MEHFSIESMGSARKVLADQRTLKCPKILTRDIYPSLNWKNIMNFVAAYVQAKHAKEETSSWLFLMVVLTIQFPGQVLDQFWNSMNYKVVSPEDVGMYVNILLRQKYNEELAKIAKQLLRYARSLNDMKSMERILFAGVSATTIKRIQLPK